METQPSKLSIEIQKLSVRYNQYCSQHRLLCGLQSLGSWNYLTIVALSNII